ncbi:MAG: mechanosensitive ion channel [Alphaproteobacteria bacterium]|nr:mechanosensitive ion channel [Alphaproteobacteria bacterium]
MEQISEQALALVTSYGLNVIGAIVVLIVGLIAAGWARKAVQRMLRRTGKVDDTLVGFLGSLVKYAVVAFTVIAVLQQFGVEATSLVAIFGAAGLAIGLALQGTLSNVAAGVMLLLFRPFKVGDVIDAGGHMGSVKAIALFTTEMATPDNVQIIIPNSAIWGTAIKNFSFNDTRRVDLVMGVDYGDDLDVAMATINRVIGEESRAKTDPEPTVAVSELADNSVNFVVRVWVEAGDYWGVYFDLTKNLKEQLEADGLNFPYPQRTVHMASAAE